MLDSRLKTFITVSKFKNITKAAEFLNLTQPAVSQQIRYLEEYYKVKLTTKEGRHLALTSEGLLFLKYCENMEALSRKIFTTFMERNDISKSYSIGATLTIGSYILPLLLGEHKKTNPNIDIILYVKNNSEILQKVINHEVDLAIVEGLFDDTKFKYKKFKDDELIFVVSPNHEFAKKKEVTLDEILKGKLILREKGSGTRDIFEKTIVQSGFDGSCVKPYMEIGSFNAIISLVKSNLGYTIISKEAIKDELQNKTLIKIPIKNLEITRSFNFIYLKDGDLDFINDFINFCCKYYK